LQNPEVAALDVLSNGRVELGLSAGFLQAEYSQAGIQFDPPSVRVERLGSTTNGVVTNDPNVRSGVRLFL
jgi:hypothetical protein